MAIKEIKFGKEGRESVLKGINILADAVGSTMGYGGKTVLVNQGDIRGVAATKDGVRVAEEIQLLDRFEALGAETIKQAAKATAVIAGDGTTTSTVLAQHLVNNGFNKVNSGMFNLTELKNGMNYASSQIVKWIDENAVSVEGDLERVKQIATISANGDEELGNLVSEAIMSVKTREVVIEKKVAAKSYFTKESGFNIDSLLYSNHFESKQGTAKCEYDNAKVLIINGMLSDVRQIIGILEGCVNNNNPLVIFAENVSDVALTTLAQNNIYERMKVSVLTLPDAGDLRKYSLMDLSIATGAKVADKDLGVKIQDLTYDDLGEVSYIKADMVDTSIVFSQSNKSAIEGQYKIIEEGLKKAKEDDDKVRIRHLETRLKRFSEGIVKIHIHADTDVEFEEKYDRLEDSVKAVLSALEQGVIDGGGLALLKASKKATINIEDKTESFKEGVNLVLEACQSPINRILFNAGITSDEVKGILNNIQKNDYKLGYDVKEMKLCNMVKAGIIDPIKVSKNALKNAVSVSGTLITTDTFIVLHDFGI